MPRWGHNMVSPASFCHHAVLSQAVQADVTCGPHAPPPTDGVRPVSILRLQFSLQTSALSIMHGILNCNPQLANSSVCAGHVSLGRRMVHLLSHMRACLDNHCPLLNGATVNIGSSQADAGFWSRWHQTPFRHDSANHSLAES